jgi:hypothetical protein
MNRIRHIRRLTAALAGLAGVLLAVVAAAPAALASGPAPLPPPIREKHPPLPPGHVVGSVYKAPIHTVVIGGMPGWQIALIAIGAALATAIAAVVLDHRWAARRNTTTAAA